MFKVNNKNTRTTLTGWAFNTSNVRLLFVLFQILKRNN